MDQAKTPNDAAARKRTSGPRDGFVYLTTALVALALALALKLHLDLAADVVAAIAMLTTVALVLAHQLYRRGQVIAGLKAELAGLRRGATANPPGPSPHMAAQRGAREPGTPPAHRPVAGAAGSGLGGQSGSAGASPGTASSSPSTVSVQAPGPAAPYATGTMQNVPLQPRQPQPPASPAYGQAPPPPPSASPTSASPASASPALGRREPGPAAREPVFAPILAMGPPPLPMPVVAAAAAEPVAGVPTKPVAVQVTGALMDTYWGHRPGERHEPRARDSQAFPASAFAVAAPDLTPFAEPGAGPAASVLVRPAADPGPGPDERELETMQNLIQQLAVQLNAPKVAAVTERPSEVDAFEAPSESALSQSLAALRATATTMRQEPQTKPQLPKEPQTEPMPQDTPVAEAGTSAPVPDVPLAETQVAKADPVAPVQPPAPSATEPASRYAQLARVAEAVAADRIEVYLDPILALADRKARLFEVSVRLRSSEGDVVDPAVIRDIASGTGLLARIDAAKLSRSARVAGRLRSRGANASLYANLASESLSDDLFLDTFEEVIAGTDDLPKRLVLSFTQADVRAFNDVHWETVLTMSELGLRFALEDVADLDMDFERLKGSGFEYVKLDAAVFLDGLPAADGAIPAPDLCRHFAGHGLALIVGRIEDELSLAKILGFGVLFGQGAIFGGARAVQVDMQPLPEVAAA